MGLIFQALVEIVNTINLIISTAIEINRSECSIDPYNHNKIGKKNPFWNIKEVIPGQGREGMLMPSQPDNGRECQSILTD